MSAKNVFRSLQVILWLTLSFSLLAQAPERTKPASETKTQPCWEQVMKTMGDGMVCLGELSEQLEAQRNNQKALEELELAGVRFLKANGYPEESAVAIIARKIKQLSFAPVAETPEPTKPVTTKEVKPAPAVSEETPRQKELVSRTEAPAQNKRLRDERQEGWKAGLPKPEEKSGYCWEGTRQNDLLECITQLKQYIKQVKADKSLPSERRQLAVTNLRDDLEKLKKIEKSAEQGVKTQRTWATARAVASVQGCPELWVHPDYAGRGWSGGMGKVAVRMINNTGGMIEKVVISGGVIIERVCPGATVTFHLTTGGNQSQQFFVSAETAALEGGVRKVKMWQKNYNLYFSSPPTEETWELTSGNKTNQYQ